jgi:photosystem II stability/assembly factor-like uncharacterized protein
MKELKLNTGTFFNCLLLLLLIGQITWSSCTPSRKEHQKPETQKWSLTMDFISLNINNHFRGLCMVDENVSWASGTNGLVMLTTDGGKRWSLGRIPQAENLDFRDIQAFDAQTALVLSAGFPAKIFRTNNGGELWTVQYSNMDSSIFFDGFAFWGNQNGMAFGDPIDGKLVLIRTVDGGENWTAIDRHRIPDQLKEEAGFAASGTGIVVRNNTVWIGLGGTTARVFRSTDLGRSWKTFDTPMLNGNGSRGIYSLSFQDSLNGIAVGGAWNEKEGKRTAAYTRDGGEHWKLSRGVDAYRSACCYFKENTYIAVGPSGFDISYDGGKSWEKLHNEPMNALVLSAKTNTGIAVGNDGRIARLTLRRNST